MIQLYRRPRTRPAVPATPSRGLRLASDDAADAPRPQPELDGSAVRRPDADDAAGPLDPRERRRSERVAESASAWLSNAVGGAMTNGRTVAVEDLSLHGMGFSSATPCRIGDKHWVLVTRGPMRLSTRLKIARVRERGDGSGWDMGGEFF